MIAEEGGREGGGGGGGRRRLFFRDHVTSGNSNKQTNKEMTLP